MRLSILTFQISPNTDHDCRLASKVFKTLDLSASGICDFNSSSLMNSDWLVEVVYVVVSLDSFDKTFLVFRHLMQSVIRASRQALGPKNAPCILVDFYPLLWVFSPEKL